MSSKPQEYSVDQEIIHFFHQTSTTRSSCDILAQELVGGTVTPIAVQGVCSYSVYAGPDHEFVVQFRLKSLGLKSEITTLAGNIYGSLVPSASYHGQIGRDDVDGKEPLSVYVMSRVKGISHLDFILAHDSPENSPEYCMWRENLISDIARLFALAWKSSQEVDQSVRDMLHQRFEKDLRRLLAALPDRFRPIIQQSIDALPAIVSLPMVLLHKDFGINNVMVDADNNHLVGVIDWAEAEIGPFGTNLHSLQQPHLWDTFSAGAGGLAQETIRTIKSARIVGLLLSHGFTSRLANMPEPEPIRDDESRAYKLLGLDGLLIAPATNLVD